MLPQKTGEPLDRTRVRDSIRALYGTGRFADIQAEVTPAEQGIMLAFTTSANFFVGAVDVEGAPPRPTENQIVNASKFQLGELYTHDKLERALENIRQLMQEDGFYRARVTAETVSHADTHQVDVLFHISQESKPIGRSDGDGLLDYSARKFKRSRTWIEGIALQWRVSVDALQRLRKKFQKQNQALSQVSIAEQKYQAAKQCRRLYFSD